MRMILAGLVATVLVWPAAAHARRVTVHVYAGSEHGASGPPIEETVRVSLPAAGRVQTSEGVRWWRRGHCVLELRAELYAPGAVKPHGFDFARRWRLDDGHVYLRIWTRGRCAARLIRQVARSAVLDRARRPCGASGKTVARNDRLRVYEERRLLWVCDRATRRRTTIGASPAGNDCAGGDFCSSGMVRLAGPFTAYTYEYAGRRESSSRVIVLDGSTGKAVLSVQSGATCPDPRYEAGPVKSLVLRADGTPAWIVADCIVYGEPQRYEVRTPAGVVGAGPGIDPGSLRLAGDTITWMQDGVARQAPFSA